MPTLNLREGAILVAHPEIRDPYFARAVILLLQFHDGGIIGVNIAAAPAGESHYIGGPLPLPSPLVLHLAREEAQDQFTRHIGDTNYATTAINHPAELAQQQVGSIVLTGYVGRSFGRLGAEIAMGVWQPTPATLQGLMAVPAEERWELAYGGVAPLSA